MFDLTCIYRLVYIRISLVCSIVKLEMCLISMYSGICFILFFQFVTCFYLGVISPFSALFATSDIFPRIFGTQLVPSSGESHVLFDFAANDIHGVIKRSP